MRLLLAVALGVALPAWAGPIYGTVRDGARPIDGVSVLVACPSLAAPRVSGQGQSDGNGSYALRVDATGRCEMQLRRGTQSGAGFQVLLSDRPLRFDLVVDAQLNRR